MPNNPVNSNLLPDAKGIFKLKMLKTNQLLLSYKVAVTNRKIIKNKNISLDGQTYEVYVHSYDFLQETIINKDQVIATVQESVTEWLVPNYGQVLQNRIGSQVINTSVSQMTVQNNLQSSLSRLENSNK